MVVLLCKIFICFMFFIGRVFEFIVVIGIKFFVCVFGCKIRCLLLSSVSVYFVFIFFRLIEEILFCVLLILLIICLLLKFIVFCCGSLVKILVLLFSFNFLMFFVDIVVMGKVFVFCILWIFDFVIWICFMFVFLVCNLWFLLLLVVDNDLVLGVGEGCFFMGLMM